MKFIIKNKTYKSRDLNSLSLGEYNELYNFLEIEKDPIALATGLLLLFTDIPLELIETLDDSIYKINWRLKLNEEIAGGVIKEKYIGYKLVDLNKITVGRYIDADHFLTKQSDDRIQTVIASLLAGDDDDIDKVAKVIEEKLTLGECLVIFNHFVNWRTNIVKKYEGLFQATKEVETNEEEEIETNEEEENVEEEQENWGWLGICYTFAKEFYYVNNKNIFDAPLISLLNFLSWNKDKIDKENAENKRRNSSIN